MADLFVTLASIAPAQSKTDGKGVDRIPGLSPSVKNGILAERGLAAGSPQWTPSVGAGLSGVVQARFERTAGLNSAVVNLLTGLVSYWKLDGDATDSVASNNGTPTNVTFSAGNGKLGQGGGFTPGSSSLINCGTSSSLEVQGGSFSLAAWVRPASFSQNYGSWILRASGIKPQYRMGRFQTTGNWGLTWWNGSTWRDYNTTGFALAVGVWSHVVAVFDRPATTLSFYKDGAPATVFTGMPTDFTTGAGTFFIGRNLEDNTYWDGAIDEVAVWNRTLSASEASLLANTGIGVQYPFTF